MADVQSPLGIPFLFWALQRAAVPKQTALQADPSVGQGKSSPSTQEMLSKASECALGMFSSMLLGHALHFSLMLPVILFPAQADRELIRKQLCKEQLISSASHLVHGPFSPAHNRLGS